jgi:chaperonin GroEL
MNNKIIEKGDQVQSRVIAGVVKAVEAIKTTIGPSGKAVAIDTDFGVEITRDGATVAKSIQLKNREENIGAELVKKAATLTEDQAGDATSTTSLLIEEFCVRGHKAVTNGANVNELKAGMLKAGKWMENYIKDNAIEIDGDLEKIRKVATISANNDPEVGNLVVEGIQKVGLNGLITADMASGLDTIIDVTTGMKLDRGWASPQYITSPEDGKCTMDNPYILVAGERISSMGQLMTLLQDYQTNSQGRPLLIICDDMDDIVNATFVMNVLHGAIRCCVVKGIDFGDSRKNIMADIAIAVGADYLCQENGTTVAQATLANLGMATRVVVSRDSTIIYEGHGDPEAVRERAEIVKARLQAEGVSDYDKTKFEKRLANLTGGIAIIRAGGATEAEKQNRKATIEDSVLAAKSAIEEGCVPGGGYIFFKGSRAAKKDKAFWKSLTPSEKEGAMTVFDSLPVVLKTIADNAGAEGVIVLERAAITKDGFVFNAKTKQMEKIEDSMILDSAKALRVSLENSISAAAMILLIDCTIIDDPETKKENGVI